VVAVSLKAVMFGHWGVLVFIFLCVLCVFVVLKKKGWKWTASLAASASVALSLVIVYSMFIDARRAMASVTQLDVYFYTSDHIGRPFNLRDADRDLRWYEHHYPFGEVITEDTPNGSMTAGGGSYAISWKPNFRFPGQYESDDMGTAANSRPLFVQNHYREYMPRFGRYNRVDPRASLHNPRILIKVCSCYKYSSNNPLKLFDFYGLQEDGAGLWDFEAVLEGPKSFRSQCRCWFRYLPEGDWFSYIWTNYASKGDLPKDAPCYCKLPGTLIGRDLDCCAAACENLFNYYYNNNKYNQGSMLERFQAALNFGWR
jgi:RHS repeat-associated protein